MKTGDDFFRDFLANQQKEAEREKTEQEKEMPEKTKEQKAAEILKNKKIDECCEWLLKSGIHSALSKVPGIESVEQESGEYCKFFYKGKSYGLFYENFSSIELFYDDTMISGDFQINIDSEDVLKADVTKNADEYSYTNSIFLDYLTKAMLGNWLEVIPKIVVEAKEIEKRQQQQGEEERARERAKKMDENIDLGEYE